MLETGLKAGLLAIIDSVFSLMMVKVNKLLLLQRMLVDSLLPRIDLTFVHVCPDRSHKPTSESWCDVCGSSDA